MSDLILTIHTQQHTYAVLHRREIELRHVGAEGGLPTTDSRNRPMFSSDLSALLDPDEQGQSWQRCAFIVPLRRRSVALLCERVDEMHMLEAATIVPLPPLLKSCLPHAWIAGIYLPEDTPILLLDLHEIALDVLRQSALSQGEPA